MHVTDNQNDDARAPVVLVVQNDDSDPIGPFGDWLVEAGLQLRLCRAYRGDAIPGNLDDYDALVVLGGHMGALQDEEYSWLPEVRALFVQAIADETPALGICLGAQLLAAATGAALAANPDGPQFGAQLVAKRSAAATDPLFASLPITPDVIQWHRDAVLTLPSGAVLLASSPGCEIEAFRVGNLAWGTQFHFETTPQIVRIWAAEDAEQLRDYDLDLLLARSDAAHADIAEVWRDFAVNFATVVADPASASTHAHEVTELSAAPITDPDQIRAALAAQMTGARGGPQPMHFGPPATGLTDGGPASLDQR